MLWVLLLNSGVYAKSAEGGRVGCCTVPRRRLKRRKVILGDMVNCWPNSQGQGPPPNSAKGLSSGDSASRSREAVLGSPRL